MSNEATKQQLALFQFTSPNLVDGMTESAKKNESGRVTSLSLSLETRKAVAKRLGLTANKDNAQVIDNEVLRLKDNLKKMALGEFVKLATDPNWTGGTFRVSQAKNGQKRATMSLVTVARASHNISEEQLVKALAMMSEDQQVALMERAEGFKKSLSEPTEVETVVDKTPAELEQQAD